MWSWGEEGTPGLLAEAADGCLEQLAFWGHSDIWAGGKGYSKGQGYLWHHGGSDGVGSLQCLKQLWGWTCLIMAHSTGDSWT